MAELTATVTTGEESAASGCCAPAVQETCCEPSEKVGVLRSERRGRHLRLRPRRARR